MQTETYYYPSPLGDLYLTLVEGALFEVAYETDDPGLFQDMLPDGELRRWLERYFSRGDSAGAPSMKIRGTDFQRRVWQSMLEIPAGTTRSYGDIARLLGSAPRAVGQACRSNHLPIVIPCHRVVGSQSVGGYEGATSGHRVDRKSWLLAHEKNHSKSA